MSTRLGLLSLFTILVPCGQLFAADLPVTAPIKAVTVFPDRAEVTRVVDVSLPAGATTLVIDNLPASLLPESVRVSGEGGKDVVIGSVETKPFYADAAVSEQERQLQAAIEELQDRRHAAEDRIASLQVQLDFIATIGRDMPATANQEIQRGSMDPAKWQAAWIAMSSGAAEAHAGMRTAEIEMRDIDAKTAKLQQELAQIQTGRSATVVARINLEAGAAESATLRLSYQLPDATWQPLYDARLDSEAGKMSLAQLGQVQQRTGEDWTGVALTLSTAQPSVGAVLPELDSWFVQVAQPLLAGELRRDVGAQAEPATPASPQNMADMDELQNKEKDKLAKVDAQLIASEFSAEYRIPGTANVPSDAAPHKFAIATHELAATLAVRAVPKQGAFAHLYAEVTYEGAEPLLPGQVSVFRDGAFVGTESMDMLRPKEKEQFGFGVDDKVRVEYRLENGEQSTSGIFTDNQHVERRYRIEIANHHSKPMEVTVLDALPVSQDERIEVEQLSDSTHPTKTDWEAHKGVLAWTYELKPAEERIINFGYALTYPAGTIVAGM
ncbi:MAG TPA: mucoidy inhibitor MuiA family protein [Candidatus Angelobacter sp.]|nr:mucoidy inhibitor MuiA family protein [Candidatus Angelobacter sp.]